MQGVGCVGCSVCRCSVCAGCRVGCRVCSVQRVESNMEAQGVKQQQSMVYGFGFRV